MDNLIIRAEQVRSIAKRRANLDGDVKQGFATLYDQCSQDVKDKLEASEGWSDTHAAQYLHELVKKIERICVGFDDHKQEVYNLIQSPKTPFLYTQKEGESVEEYARNLTSLWDTSEAFGASPGVHKALVDALLEAPGQVADPDNITEAERALAERETSETVKAALMISLADKRRFGSLKSNLGNEYLLGEDKVPPDHRSSQEAADQLPRSEGTSTHSTASAG